MKMILILGVAALLLTAQTQAQNLDDANRAFSEGHYQQSTLGYQKILAQQGYSAPVLFDLGNSYFRQGDFAHAIVAYNQAKWLSPNDPDIAANLSLAQQQAGLPIVEPSWSEQLTGLMSATNWAWFGSGALTLLCLSLLARAALPTKRTFCTLSAVGSAIGLFTAITAMAFLSEELRSAVVIDKNASALISPFPGAQAAFTLIPGQLVTLGEPYHDFVLLKDAGGRIGWINRSQIAQIIPPSSSE